MVNGNNLISDEAYMIDMACRGRFANVHRCITQGVDVNCTDNNGNTALHVAAREEHIDIIKLLVRSGANTQLKNADGLTALDLFVRENNILKVLRGEVTHDQIALGPKQIER